MQRWRPILATTCLVLVGACSAPTASTVAIPDAGPLDGSSAHGCAVTTDGQVRCWGSNLFGQLGDGTLDDAPSGAGPVVGVEGATAVAAGPDFSCAVLGDGSAACWGYNLTGQIGDGTSDNLRLPTPVLEVSDATAVAAGLDHACAATALGAWCWGANHSGQLGDGTREQSNRPVMVTGLGPTHAIAAGAGFTCALDDDGAAWCWGQNGGGQLGDGTDADRDTPVRVRGLPPGIDGLDAGLDAACALDGGRVTCWGGNPTDPSLEDAGPPWSARSVRDLTDATSITLGERVGCSTTADEGVWCWDPHSATPRARPVADLSPPPVDDRLAIVADRPCVARNEAIRCFSPPAFGD